MIFYISCFQGTVKEVCVRIAGPVLNIFVNILLSEKALKPPSLKNLPIKRLSLNCSENQPPIAARRL